MYNGISARALCCSTALAANAENIVAAGRACETVCVNYDADTNINSLAQIQFPIQTYSTGFCPDEALCEGTLFPELVH